MNQMEQAKTKKRKDEDQREENITLILQNSGA